MDKYIPIQKANTLDDVYGAVMTQPLSIEDMDKFYCDTDEARGAGLGAREELADVIRRNAQNGRDAHILFVGYRGCGKSTELNHLQKDLQKEFMVLNYSVVQELDPQSINYIELFIVTMEKLFSLAIDNNILIEQGYLDKIVTWTKTTEIQNINDRHLGIELEAGSESKFVIPYLQKFFLKMKAAAKASTSFKETVKRNIEPRLSELIEYCNNLLSAIRAQLVSQGKRDLLIFIEDLDKIPYDRAVDIFFNYANQLTQLKATVVYTFPVTLYHHIRFVTIRGCFNEVIELPMVKTRFKDGTVCPEGLDVLRQIVDLRINKSLFASESLLDEFILACGGVIRDLFTLLVDAARLAENRDKATIDETHYAYAFNKLKKVYDNSIADYRDEDGDPHTAVELYNAMVELVGKADKRPTNAKIMLMLRQNLCVLSYNGEGWCDVHPAMKAVLIDRKYLKPDGTPNTA